MSYKATPGMTGVNAIRYPTPAEQQTRVVALAKKEKSGRDAVSPNRQVSAQRIRMGHSLRPGR